MTKVRMLQAIAGHADPAKGLPDFSYMPGQLVTLPAALASAWISAGICVATSSTRLHIPFGVLKP
jgi:hypothetical protein